jgi:toxoflavin synthase
MAHTVGDPPPSPQPGAGDQFSPAAQNWREVEEFPVRHHVEFPTVFKVLGQVDGLDVLDVGCGSGLYCELAAERGARRIIGMDSSSAMLTEAEQRTQKYGERVKYVHTDVTNLPVVGQFDIALAMFVLPYIPARDALDQTLLRIAEQLKPGGRFLAAIPNSRFDASRPYDDRYNVWITWPNDRKDGAQLTVHIKVGQGLQFQGYFWTFETYKLSLESAGFHAVQFHPFRPSDEAIRDFPDGFWRPMIDNPLNVVISATKPQ